MITRVTEEMVFKAANEIDKEGRTPRVPDIRTKLGVGSYSTIHTYLKKWKEEQQTDELEEIKEEAPELIRSRLEAFSASIWNVAIEMANERLRSEREALESVRKEMEEQQRETAEMADRLSEEIEILRAKFDDLTDLLEIEKTSHTTTRSMLQTETDQVIKLAAQIEASTRHIEDLKEENRSTRNMLENYIERDGKQKSEIVRLEEVVKYKKEDMDNLVETLETLQKERDQAKENEKDAQANAQASEVQAAKLLGEIQSLKKQVDQQAKMFENFTKSLKNSNQKNNNNKSESTPDSQ